MATQAFEKLGKQLNVFQSKLELFDGTTNVNDFVSDIQRYCEYVGQTDDCEKLNVLISHLTGEAKDTFRNVKDPEFDSVISALQIRFAPTELALHRVKAELFGTKQMSGETCKQFAIRVQNAARHTDLTELDLVKVVIEGLTTSELRNHIMMAAPTSIDNLIKLPVVADERVYYDCASRDNFSLLTAAVSNLSSQVAQLSKSTKHDARAESHVTRRDQEQGQARYKPSGVGKRIAPYRKPQQCSRCSLKCCQGTRLCVAFTKTCRKCGKVGHFQRCCHTQPKNYFNEKHWRWLPVHKMDRPPYRLASEKSVGKIGGKVKSKDNSVKVQSVQNENKKNQQNKSSKSNEEPVILQYQVDEQALSNFNVEILYNETSSHYPKPPFNNMINAKFGVLQTQCLLDTGATISCISTHFLDKIPRKFVKTLSHRSIVIQGFGGFQKRVKERVELTFTINGRKFSEQFYSVSHSYNVILGLPFLKKYKAILNMANSEITLDGQTFPLKPPSMRSSLVKLCNHEIIPAYTIKTVQVKLNKPVISEFMYVCAVSSLHRTQPDLEIVESLISHQNTLCRIVNNSNEPIALSKDTAIALARNVHSNDVLEMHHLFENDQVTTSDDVQCECAKCLHHDDLQPPHNEGRSVNGSQPRDGQPAVTREPQPATRGPAQSSSAESGQMRSSQGHSNQTADGTGKQINGNLYNMKESRNVNNELKCKCNATSDLTCDQFDFSADLQNIFGEFPVNTVNINTTNADILNNISATEEFENHKKVHSFDAKPNESKFQCQLKNVNKNGGNGHKTKSKHVNKTSQVTEGNDENDPYDKTLKFYINPNQSSDVKIDFAKFLQGNKKRFSTCRKEMGFNDKYPHYMETTDEKPVPLRYNRMSPKLQKVLDDEIEDLLRHGFIEPSTSSWRSPVVMVKKPHSDEYRLCVDYRLTNAKTTPESFPTMTLEEIWEIIGVHKPALFSKLDLMSGYQQLAMHPDTKHKSTFVVRGNSYQWNRLPFGLRNAPITFQKLMADVLKGLLFKTCLIYLDDIIVWGDCIECHKKNLQEVFDRLEKANLTLKASKCEFAMEEIAYLGHVLSKNGVKPNLEKVEIIKNYARPQNVKQLRQFLGLSQYYRRFQKNFSNISRPLYDLTKKDAEWIWSDECEKSFQTLKTNLITAPILAFPNPNRPYLITCDASTTGLGFILSQKDENGIERVISYSGRALRKAEKNYSITELEALSVIAAFKQFHPYIYGNFVTLRTDHKALQYIYKNKTSKGRLMRWVLELMNYDYEIEHKPGINNEAADALSRLPEFPKSTENQPEIPGDSHIMTVTAHRSESDNVNPEEVLLNNDGTLQKFDWQQVSIFEETENELDMAMMMDSPNEYCFDIKKIDIIAEQKSCEEIGPWYQFIKTGNVPPNVDFSKAKLSTADQFAIKDGILVHLFQPRTRNIHRYHPIITQIVVPKKLRAQLLSEFHDSLTGGSHQSFDRVYQAIRQRFYWPRMYEDIHEYHKTCKDCQRASTHHPKRPPLNPLPVAGLFERIQMDYLGPFRQSKCGKRWILLVIDSFSGWCEAFALPNADAITTAKVLYSEIFTRYGAPRYLLSDRGANFLSTLVQALCEIFSIKRVRTSSYHPASNARCEKFNAFINKSLRTMVDESQEDWPDIIPGIMMAYRCTPARASQFSPYFLLFGKEMTTPIETAINPNITEVSPNYRDTLKSFIDNVKVSRKIAHDNIVRSQQQMKEYYDRNSAPPRYKLGDIVWLHDPTTPVGFSRKLKPRWRGPYRISEIGPNSTYRLRHYSTDLPTDTLINAQRIKPAYLPWESRIRREDPNRQQQRGLLQRNPAPAPQDIGQKRPTAAPQLRTNTGTQPAKQGNSSSKNKSGQGKYQNTTSEIQKPTTSDNQQQQNTPLEVEKVVNVKRNGPVKWYKVKLKNVPGLPWYSHGSIDIPEKLIQECLKTRTWEGKPRKRKK